MNNTTRVILPPKIKMSQTLPLPPPGFDSLSIEEQIEYIEALWDHVSERPELIPVPDWHQEIIAERLASPHALDDAKTWEEFEQQLSDDLTTPLAE